MTGTLARAGDTHVLLALAAAALVLPGCAGGTDADPAAALVCDDDRRQTATVALAAGEPGAATPEDAVDGGDLGVPAGDVVLEDAQEDDERVDGLVRDGEVVVAEVTVLRTPDGWFLESATTCG